MATWGLTSVEWEAVRLSLLVGATAVSASLPLGVALGWLLARKRFWGKSALETAINLPLVLPPVVTGYLLLMTFGRRGWLGQHLDALAFASCSTGKGPRWRRRSSPFR